MGLTPTIGRLVHYTLSSADADQINRRRTTGDSIRARLKVAGEPRWPEGAQAHIGTPVVEGEIFPMLIVRLTEALNVVNGKVFLDGTDTLWVQAAAVGVGPGHWEWPRLG